MNCSSLMFGPNLPKARRWIWRMRRHSIQVRKSSRADRRVAAADAMIVAAGRGGRPGETRLQLLRENALAQRKAR
jgi:hypothetical protein